jgi:hypothetical protein
MVGCQIKMFVNIKSARLARKNAFTASRIAVLYDSNFKMLYLLAEKF